MLSTDKQTDRQTDRQTDKLTNATKNITSFAKEVIISIYIQNTNIEKDGFFPYLIKSLCMWIKLFQTQFNLINLI